MTVSNHRKRYRPLHWRILLTTFFLVLVICWGLMYQVLRASRQQMIDGAFDVAIGEHTMLCESMRTYVDGVLARSPKTYDQDAELRNALLAYARYYTKENARFSISDEAGHRIQTNMTYAQHNMNDLMPNEESGILSTIHLIGETTCVFASSMISLSGQTYRIDSSYDITGPVKSAKALASRVAIGMALAFIGLLLVLFFVIRAALQPLRALREQARAIAGGDYGRRVVACGNDEVGWLAADFNEMADAIELHIKSLRAMTQSRERFSANLGHELKTPITSILGYAELARRTEVAPAQLQTMLTFIRNEAIRIDDLSEKLLTLSALAHDGRVAKRMCEAQRIVSQVEQLAAPLLAQRRQTLCTVQTADVLFCDDTLLISLLINLIKNASQASDECANIRLTVEQADTETIIRVIDDGIGISQEDLASIGEPFYVVDKSRSRLHGNMGLGLALCQTIVATHAGKMHIESAPGKGTTVEVRLVGSSLLQN